MFEYKRVEKEIINHKYIQYLKSIGINTENVLSDITNNIEKNGYILDRVFSNRSYQILSPNIFLEEVVFKEVNQYLYQNYHESVVFEEYVKLDVKSIIATQNSIMERPKIELPVETKKGIKKNLNVENGYIRIARFENQFISDSSYLRRKGQSIVLEGLSFYESSDPFVHYLPSFLIWHNAFYGPDEFVVGIVKQRNSIETENLLWINSHFLDILELKLDDYQNGLRALNSHGEVVLEYRQWRDELIGNGASFVGQDSNIAKLEGCDLILREDYYNHLKEIFPNILFNTQTINYD